MFEWVVQTFQGAVAGVRSTVLVSLASFALILVMAVALFKFVGLPDWIVGATAMLLILDVLAAIVAFFYFMIKDPDALRSEKFTIQKMAIREGVYGDDLAGIVDLEKMIGETVMTPHEAQRRLK